MRNYNSAVIWAADTDLCLDGVAGYCMEEATNVYRNLNSSCCKSFYQIGLLVNLYELITFFHVIHLVCFATPALWCGVLLRGRKLTCCSGGWEGPCLPVFLSPKSCFFEIYFIASTPKKLTFS